MSETAHTPKPGTQELHTLASKVQLVVFDVDGVLTQGGLHYGPQGEVMKTFHVRDGHGMVLARLLGLKVAWLTARSSEIVATRAKELGVTQVLQGQKDKKSGMLRILAEANLAAEQVAYMGDDLNDLPPLSMVGLPSCPADAVLEVRQEALFISKNGGGQGAARELLELVLKATKRWDEALRLMREGV